MDLNIKTAYISKKEFELLHEELQNFLFEPYLPDTIHLIKQMLFTFDLNILNRPELDNFWKVHCIKDNNAIMVSNDYIKVIANNCIYSLSEASIKYWV